MRPKIDIRSLARVHTETAINTLKSIASSRKAAHAARVAAAVALLDRGWGKPAQFIEHTGDVKIERIERVIVDEQGLQPIIDEPGHVVNKTADGETIN